MIKNKNILLVKGSDGLGNRILCLLTAFLYARLTKRQLVVDWSDHNYSNDGSNVFNRFFQCNGSVSTDELPDTDSVAPLIWRNHLRESVLEMGIRYTPKSIGHPNTWSKFSIDLSKLDYQEDVLVMWSFFEQVRILRRHFSGEFAALHEKSTKTILRKVLEENLILNPLIRERIDGFKDDWPKRRTVGVHIRYTDKKSRVKAMCRKLNTLFKHDPEMQIFLATDNIDIKEMLENKHSRVITTPKWYPAPGKPMHKRSAYSDRVEHGIGALVDMYLLAECDCLILDESSSFAYVASLLARMPSTRIYNFQRGRRIPSDVRHQIWILMRRLRVSLFK